MRYEQEEMTYRQTESVLCSAPSLGSRQQGKKAALEVFSLHNDREKLYQRGM